MTRRNGSATKLRFETSPGDNYDVTLSEHWVAQYHLLEDGLYDAVLSNQAGQELSRETDIQVSFEDRRVLAGVQTWNHLTRLIDGKRVFRSQGN